MRSYRAPSARRSRSERLAREVASPRPGAGPSAVRLPRGWGCQALNGHRARARGLPSDGNILPGDETGCPGTRRCSRWGRNQRRCGLVATPAGKAELRNCRSRAEGRAPIQMVVRPNDFRIGPLVLGNVRSTDGDGPSGDPEWPFGRKIPVLLPARSRVVLAIAPEVRESAELQHRTTFVQAGSLHLLASSESPPGRTTELLARRRSSHSGSGCGSGRSACRWSCG
jgi:hypothetical protein